MANSGFQNKYDERDQLRVVNADLRARMKAMDDGLLNDIRDDGFALGLMVLDYQPEICEIEAGGATFEQATDTIWNHTLSPFERRRYESRGKVMSKTMKSWVQK